MNTLIQDLRYALRQLRKSPGFALVAVLTLALGIGANTAIFSVIESVLLRPLPFQEADRLVWLNGKIVPMTDEAAVSPPDFRDYRADNRSFQRIAAMGYVASPSNLSGDRPEQVLSSTASADFFDCLGMHLLLGRDFRLSDEQVAQPQVAILGYGLWKRDFGGDREVVGRTIRMDGLALTVVGVLSSDMPLLSQAQVWVPTPMLNRFMNFRMGHSLKAIARLKAGVTLEQSQADLDAIALELQQHYPDTNKNWWMRQRPLEEVLIGPVRPALLLLWGAVGLLLLIAAGNVANLLLARSIARQKEFALRAALGAGRRRLLRQALTESVLLSVAGGGLGVIAAWFGIRALHVFAPGGVPRLNESGIDSSVLAFTLAISFFTGVIFGLAPALRFSGTGVKQGLSQSARTSAPASHKRLTSGLVIGEIAVSLTLLVSAGLVLRSFWRLTHVSPGFATEHVVTARLSLPTSTYGGYGDPSARARFWRQLEARIVALPGMEGVGATSELPLSGLHNDDPFHIPGRSYGPSEFDDAQFRQVTPGYLSVMSIPLIAGRWLNEHDDEHSPAIVVVNQAFVKQFFPKEDVLGKRLQLTDEDTPREIVGVVGDIRHISLSEPDWAEMYVPYEQFAAPAMDLVVRATIDPMSLANALRAEVSAVDKDITLSSLTSMDDVLDASVARPRFTSQLLGTFAGLALVLAAIGLYGLMAYSINERRKEIGIRMALGATRADVLKLVLRHGSMLTFAGLAIGVAIAMFATQLLSTMLFDISAKDPQTFLVVAFVFVVVALGACYVPARRAARVDPVVALRYE